MPVTKIHPIRSTLKKAIKYVANPDKTEELMYVSTYGCSLAYADLEFESTRAKSSFNGRLNNTLAQHVIQSFAEGEVTPAEAHEIGKELIAALTDNKNEYVLATHMDGKHIHNHIIFNQVDFEEHKHFKSNIHTVKMLRELSDKICAEHNIETIKEPKGKGKSYYEWLMDKNGKSYKRQLKDNIDALIPIVSSYDELLTKMEELGYEIKHGKYDSFRFNEQERFTRSKTLGEEYTREAIERRIAEGADATKTVVVIKPVKVHVFHYDQSLGLIRFTKDILDSINSEYYRNEAFIMDAKKLAATYNYLVAHNIDSTEAMEKEIARNKSEYKEVHTSIREIESQISDLKEIIKCAEQTLEYKDAYTEYLRSGKSTEFRESHRAAIVLYESAQDILKSKYPDKKTINIKTLNRELNALELQKCDLSARLSTLGDEKSDLMTVKKNIDILLDQEKEEKSKKKEQSRW